MALQQPSSIPNLLGLSLAVLVGMVVGVGTFTFGYAEGWSYLSSDPRACVNCHIMTPQYSSWMKSSHHAVATCNDCHLPHSFVSKWLAKAENGFNHSWAFTFQDFHEPIQITPKNAAILQGSCLTCHESFMHEVLGASAEEILCVRCHGDVGHGERAGLGRAVARDVPFEEER